MRDIMMSALRASLVTWVLCGIAYPLALTGLGQWLMPVQANGSLERNEDGVVIGSRLIGQHWNGPKWFHGRRSATTDTDPHDPTKTVPAPYNAASSGASNLGPTSKGLAQRLSANRKALEEMQPELVGAKLPADILTTSGSGLDPDISPANAALQVARIAQARGIPPARSSLRTSASGEWINDHTHGQQFKARFIHTSAPTSIDGIEKYLGSGMIRGIGPVYAKKMVNAFGEKAFDIIEVCLFGALCH
jgi:K+-transporting ATPase ATPase C chain